MSPKVSVIMPTYNGARFIKKSINSVLSQTLKDFELIIINDGSTDNTKDIIRRYHDKRIIYLENKKNQGVSKARNKSLRYAHGEYIAYCDHDDIYYPKHLEKFAKILDEYPEIGLVYANYLVAKRGAYKKVYPNIKFSKERLRLGKIIGAPLNVMHRIECIKKVGDFDESSTINMHSCEDLDLWLRILNYYKCYRINEVLSKYTLHGENRSYKVNFFKSYIYVIKKRLSGSRSELFLYIPDSIGIIKSLLESGMPKYIKYAFILSEKLYSIKRTYQTVACLGLCSLAKGDFLQATEKLNRSLNSMPKSYMKDSSPKEDRITVALCLAKSYLHLGEIDKALKICAKIKRLGQINIKNGSKEKKFIQAQCYIKKRNLNKALRVLSGIREFDAYLLRSICYYYKKRYNKSVRELEKAKRIHPDERFLNYIIGIVYNKLEKKISMQPLKRTLRSLPSNAQTEMVPEKCPGKEKT